MKGVFRKFLIIGLIGVFFSFLISFFLSDDVSGVQRVPSVPLKLYWNAERGDNFTAATPEGIKSAIEADYSFVRDEGCIATTPVGSFTVPLDLYWNPERADNFSVSTDKDREAAINAGYHFVRTQGYVFTGFPTNSRSKLLVTYWNPERRDHFSTATDEGHTSAINAGYRRLPREARVVYTKRLKYPYKVVCNQQF